MRACTHVVKSASTTRFTAAFLSAVKNSRAPFWVKPIVNTSCCVSALRQEASTTTTSVRGTRQTGQRQWQPLLPRCAAELSAIAWSAIQEWQAGGVQDSAGREI